MKSRVMRSWMLAFAAAALLAGCSDNSGYQAGELGHGGFFFSCDDAVACSRYSDDAAKFPKSVSLGATFAVRFVPKTDTTGINIHFDDKATDSSRGVTIESIGGFVTRGPKGLTTQKSGYASLVSRDAAGFVIDYVVIRIAKPDALVVYEADGARVDPPRVDKVELVTGDRRAFRAFAQEKKEDLAGSLQVEWKSSDRTIAEVESTTDGKAMLVARKAGIATLTATGGTFVQDVPVEVK